MTQSNNRGAAPRVTVVINILTGGPHLRRCIEALLAQQNQVAMEVVVPVCPAIDDVEGLRSGYPGVRFVTVDKIPYEADASDPGLAHMIYCRRRAVGLAAARGDIIALTEDHIIPDPNWCAAMAEAHLCSYAAIGGAVQNARQTTLHRALYLFDFGSYQGPFTAGEAIRLTDQNVSYKRHGIEMVRHVWEDLYHESAVHESLRAAGETLWLTPECVVHFDRGRLALRQQLRERFAWGRVFGGERAQRASGFRRAVPLALSPLVPGLIVVTRVLTALRKGYSLGWILRILPALSAMALWWAAGEAVGCLTGRPFPVEEPGMARVLPVQQQ